MNKIGFIGGGKMATAIIKGIINSMWCEPKNIFVSDKNENALDSLKENYHVSTTIDNIDFTEHSKFVINREFERGTESEIDEIIRFYGREKILSELDITQHSPFAINIRKNLKQYLNYEA